MTDRIGHLRFPATPLRGPADFQRFEAEHSDRLNEQLRQEMLFVKERRLIMEGTCGVCLAVTRFTSESTTSHGAYARDQQLCGCENKLSSHRRALLHFAAHNFGGDWFRLGLFGRDEALTRALSATLPPAWIWSGTEVPDEPAGGAATHMVLSADALATVPSLPRTLAHIAQALMPGGLFIFTIPFDPRAMTTAAPLGNAPRLFGWDILDQVREAGFLDCIAHCYWSAEFGLLGTRAMIFKAFR
jgi:hypothetical protein